MDKRPWLDQIALPVALQKLRIAYQCLDESFNYPAHIKPLNPKKRPFFCHYHFPEVIRREPLLIRLVQELAGAFPAIESIVSENPEWGPILTSPYSKKSFFSRALRRAPMVKNSHPLPEMIITGMPRSGTSYLCNILHRMTNCVVINEPVEIFPPLMNQPVPWGVATFYRNLRRDILEGKPIKNKLHHGEIVEDTLLNDERSTYFPKVRSPDFVLATKNTLTYLSRLDDIRRAMPDARVVVCVRNPIDTIASWKSSFPHLQNADIQAFPVGHPKDPFLGGWQQKMTSEISRIQDVSVRRAALWRYLAELIVAQGDCIVLIKYDDLITQPSRTLKKIFKGWYRCPPLLETIAPGSLRAQKRSELDENDLQAIRSLCSQGATDLGIEPFLWGPPTKASQGWS